MHWDDFPMMNLTCSISYVHDEATLEKNCLCFIVKRSQFDSHSQAEDAITRSMESLEPIR